MAEQTVHISVNKFSNAEIVEKANRILDIVFAHLEKDCPHCKEMLSEHHRVD
jgi:hypothetical protein